MSSIRRQFAASTGPTVMMISRAALIGLIVLFVAVRLAGITVTLQTQAAIYLLGMVALNLPHGGYEHFSNLRRRAMRFRGKYIIGYLLMATAFMGIFILTPVIGLAIAIAIAVAKGGGGDLYALQITAGTDHIQSRAHRLLAVAARGGAVMAVPIVAFPETFHAFSSLMIGMVDPGGLTGIARYFDVTRIIIGIGYAITVIGHLGVGYRHRPVDGSGWIVDAVETILLIGYFAVVPVVVAVGLYFPLWYSIRQVVREITVETTTARGSDLLGGTHASVGTVALRAWGILIAGALTTAIVAVGFWWVIPNPVPGESISLGLVAFWSVFISVIALPHVLIGNVLDYQRGIWHVP
ncbi:MAG: beta-carotene 15,15''-monooxygenase, Brp/Blh family [Haloquadratum walsbyi J07HQW1]|uniref:Probable beta-carotene 15,15'-dioxygenase n=1 Tax=Haloquadratum walsbyi J07HQW1 TaxID=1238424 RepID=U1N480_9EURY|nr:MAG: beta-carotene 15,15''-monooxygenase, Brp/Blh family [Haloquadratum walsbyi J07HQW1]